MLQNTDVLNTENQLPAVFFAPLFFNHLEVYMIVFDQYSNVSTTNRPNHTKFISCYRITKLIDRSTWLLLVDLITCTTVLDFPLL